MAIAISGSGWITADTMPMTSPPAFHTWIIGSRRLRLAIAETARAFRRPGACRPRSNPRGAGPFGECGQRCGSTSRRHRADGRWEWHASPMRGGLVESGNEGVPAASIKSQQYQIGLIATSEDTARRDETAFLQVGAIGDVVVAIGVAMAKKAIQKKDVDRFAIADHVSSGDDPTALSVDDPARADAVIAGTDPDGGLNIGSYRDSIDCSPFRFNLSRMLKFLDSSDSLMKFSTRNLLPHFNVFIPCTV